MILLQTEGLVKAFGGLRAVNNVSLAIEQGELSSIIGPNGAGKTTLFNIITKNLTPTDGRTIFQNEDITRLPPYKICYKGLVRSFQKTNIFPNFSAFENIQASIFMYNKKQVNMLSRAHNMYRDDTDEILAAIELKENAHMPVSSLPYGDQRKVEIGIALAFQPKLLLLDEPTAGMSRVEALSMAKLVAKLANDRGLTIVFIEHDMDVVLAISQKIRVMHQGAVLIEGKPEEIRKNSDVRRIYLGDEE